MIAQESFVTSYKLWFQNGDIIIRLKNSKHWMNIFLFRKVETIYKPTKRERCGVKILMLFDWEWNWFFAEFHCLHWSNYRVPNPLANLPLPFDNYKGPSKVALWLLHGYLNNGYCVALWKIITGLLKLSRHWLKQYWLHR